MNPGARSFRSMAVGWCTLLFDAGYDSQIRNSGFNPFRVCRLEQPAAAFEKLCDWSARGVWFAVESHPEIADADGVPGLDLYLADENQCPKDGKWLVSGSQFLDVPSGELLIAYEQEFFDDGYLDDFPTFDASSSKTESLDNREFCDATSYKMAIDPGFYVAHAFTRDLANDQSLDGRHAQLTIQLVPAKRPKKYDSAKPLVPYAG